MKAYSLDLNKFTKDLYYYANSKSTDSSPPPISIEETNPSANQNIAKINYN